MESSRCLFDVMRGQPRAGCDILARRGPNVVVRELKGPQDESARRVGAATPNFTRRIYAPVEAAHSGSRIDRGALF